MERKTLAALVFVILTAIVFNPWTAFSADSGEAAAPMAPITYTVALKNREGASAGKAVFTQGPTGVIIKAELEALPFGEHGFHIHEKADCSGDFKGAGGHLNPEGHPHGMLTYNGPHDGDLPNIYAGADGRAHGDFYTERLTLDPADTSRRAQLLDEDGSALMVHAGPDDYSTQPSGGAGTMIACGEIRKQGNAD